MRVEVECSEIDAEVSVKKIGVLFGMENTFPGALVERLNSMGVEVGEFVGCGEEGCREEGYSESCGEEGAGEEG